MTTITPLRPVPAFLPAFMMKAEAVKLTAYLDSGKVWTVGVGHTGPEVIEGYVISMDTAMLYLRQDLAIACRRLAIVVHADKIAAMSENQYAAMISFVFNVGYNSSWEIWKVINAGKFAAVPDQLIRFDQVHDAKGVAHEVEGLKHRREAEKAMWNTPDPVDKTDLANAPPLASAIVENAPVDMPGSGALRMSTTPPKVAPTQPHIIAGLWASGTGLIMAAPEGIKSLHDTIAPYADGSDMVAKACGGLMTAAAVAAGVAFVLQLRAHNAAKN